MKKCSRVWRAYACACVLFVAAPVAVRAQSGSATAVITPRSEPATINSRIDNLFAQWDQPTTAGCALGVVQNGRFVYERGYGMADLEHNVPITPQTVFHIASASKQFTAAAVLLLVDDGKLSLDDDVRKYIPELPVYERPITVRQLIYHTSGLRDYLSLMALAGMRFEDVHSEAEILDVLTRQRALNFAPGDDYVYSNSGYFLLGVLVKRVTGQTLRQFTQERIFLPLGMRSTHFHDNRSMIVKNRAFGYAPVGDHYELDQLPNFENVGDGGVMTTIEDLLLWDQNFYQDRLGTKGFVSRMLAPGLLANGDTVRYGAGLMLGEYRGFQTVSHDGGFTGFRMELVRFPQLRFSVMVLCNNGAIRPTQLARDVADIYLADGLRLEGQEKPAIVEPKRKYVQLSLDTLRARAGTYRNPKTGALWRLAERNGNLYVTVSGQTLQLGATSPTRFRTIYEPPRVEFRFDKPKAKKGVRTPPWLVRVVQDGTGAEDLEAVHLDLPTMAELAEYIGEYTSEELGTTYHVALWEDRLVVRTRDGDVRTLVPLMRDRFAADIWEIIFTRDQNNAISGFLLDAGRVWNLRFDRLRPPAPDPVPAPPPS